MAWKEGHNMTFEEFYKFYRPEAHQQALNDLVAANPDFVVDSWMRSMMLGAWVMKIIKKKWEEASGSSHMAPP